MSWVTERLAARMRERQLTGEVLARQLAIERSRLNAILGGAARPNDNLIRRLARAFGDDPNEWLAHAAEPASGTQAMGAAAGLTQAAKRGC